MDEKELNALLDRVDGRVKQNVQDAVNGFLTLDQLEAKLKGMGIENDSISKLTKAAEEQGAAMRELVEKGKKGIVKSITEILQENMEKIKGIGSDKGRKVSFYVPKTNVTTSSITSDPTTYVIPGFNDTALKANTIEETWRALGLVQDIPADSHGVISYTDLTTRTNNAAMTAEASVYPENAYAWTGYTKTIEKAIASIPVTWEALTDIPQMQATINRLIAADVVAVKEQQLWSGTGTAPQVQGIYTAAQTASPSGTSITNSDPNIFDLALWMRNYIWENYGGKFMPNVMIMNPGNALQAKWTKASDGQYVGNPFLSPDGMQLAGMRIIESGYVTANTMLVGDLRYARLYIGNGVEIEVGLDGNDFTYDLYTVKARQRFCVVIPSVDTYGLLKSTDIATDLTYLNSGE